jgi:uncharacterized protein (DUF697 family)
MHDIDRTLTEFETGMDAFTADEFTYNEAETYNGSGFGEVFDEAEEMELAAELLGVTDEVELDQFLGKLLKSAGRNIGKFLNSPTGRKVGGMLKNVARQALPTVGGVLGGLAATGIGSAVGVPIPPQVGSAIGGQLASAAGSMFGLELEGLSPEDQEFEVARRFVRLAGHAVKHATAAHPQANSQTAARAALTAAARHHAPGLLRKLAPTLSQNGRTFSEADEMEFATELLEVMDEDELDQFLGKLIKKAGQTVGKVVKSPIGKSLGGIVKGIAKQALPLAGGALGSLIPIPGVGTAVGSALGSAVSKSLEMELEGMEPEDQEFEGARRFVRMVGDATKKAVSTVSQINPQTAAKSAVTTAVKKHAPGLLSLLGEFEDMPALASTPTSAMMPTGNSGRWIRRGQKIVLLGV